MEWPPTLLVSLNCYSEQLSDEHYLTGAVSFVHTLHLYFPYHVYHFIALQCSPCRVKRKEAHAWFNQSFDEAMVLFDKVVEVLALPQFTGIWLWDVVHLETREVENKPLFANMLRLCSVILETTLPVECICWDYPTCCFLTFFCKSWDYPTKRERRRSIYMVF